MSAAQFREQYGVTKKEFDGEVKVTHEFEFKALGEAIESDFSILSESAQVEFRQAGAAEYRTAFALDRRAEEFNISSQPELRSDPLWRRLIGASLATDDTLAFFGESLSPTSLISTTIGVNPILRYFGLMLGRAQVFQLIPIECRLPGSPTPNAELGQHGANLPALVAHIKRTAPPAWTKTLDAMRSILPGLQDIRTSFTPD